MNTLLTRDDVIKAVRAHIHDLPSREFELVVDDRAVWQDDDWWHVVVKPSRPGVRAYDYAETLTNIEEQIQEKYDLKVLLVPALAED